VSREVTSAVVSNNVHEKPEYLMGQIENIKENLLIPHRIIVSPNEYMQDQLAHSDGRGFILNPEAIEKRRHHGSITRGIVSNMALARKRLKFGWFLVMSSREFFYRKLNNPGGILRNKCGSTTKDYERKDWHWGRFHATKLHAHIRANRLFLADSPHEGMCFDAKGVTHILRFLEGNEEIAENLFNFEHCVEEFALQSICANFRDFYYIGNGTEELMDEALDPRKFTRKKPR
jgi:hypothetical protein